MSYESECYVRIEGVDTLGNPHQVYTCFFHSDSYAGSITKDELFGSLKAIAENYSLDLISGFSVIDTDEYLGLGAPNLTVEKIFDQKHRVEYFSKEEVLNYKSEEKVYAHTFDGKPIKIGMTVYEANLDKGQVVIKEGKVEGYYDGHGGTAPVPYNEVYPCIELDNKEDFPDGSYGNYMGSTRTQALKGLQSSIDRSFDFDVKNIKKEISKQEKALKRAQEKLDLNKRLMIGRINKRANEQKTVQEAIEDVEMIFPDER